MEPKKKFFLFKQSDHFCSAPWNQFEVFSDGAIKTCTYGIPYGNLNTNDIDNILTNQTVQDLKLNLLNDRLTDNCTRCNFLRTSNEHFDLRNHYNPMFKSAAIDYEDLTAFSLNAIDLHWDNTCNFKCIYCNPKQSSSIAQEQNIRTEKILQSNVDKIINLVLENQQNLKEIYLSGGEPLLIKHNSRLLSALSNTDIPIRVNSNISYAHNGNLVFDELKRFKNVLWTVSADSMFERFDYTRFGGSWNLFIKNLSGLAELHHSIRLNLVFFIGNVIDIFDTIEFFVKEFGISDITINQLVEHPVLLARNSPQEIKNIALSKLETLLGSGLVNEQSNAYYNILRCQQDLKLPVDDPLGYKKYFDGLDQKRGTNWKKVFPELI